MQCPDSSRFESKYEIDGSGCFVWQAGVSTQGYGKFKVGGKTALAHRWNYQRVKGEIPKGMVLDHLCRNRRCVNPEHLEVVDTRENVLRGVGPSAANETKTHCVNGHEFTAGNTYHRRNGRECRKCWEVRRRRDGSSKREGSSVHRGVSWKPDRGKWLARAYENSKPIHLGYFNTESDAAAAVRTYNFNRAIST